MNWNIEQQIAPHSSGSSEPIFLSNNELMENDVKSYKMAIHGNNRIKCR